MKIVNYSVTENYLCEIRLRNRLIRPNPASLVGCRSGSGQIKPIRLRPEFLSGRTLEGNFVGLCSGGNSGRLCGLVKLLSTSVGFSMSTVRPY